MKTVDVQELLKRGAYFGHRISRTNPRIKPYVYKAQNDIYLIDLFKTKASIEEAVNTLLHAGREGEDLLIVATKRIIKQYVKDFASENSVHYITEKWVAGFFTNFEEIKKNIKHINKSLEDKKTGRWDTMLKHERAKLEKQINKLLRVYEGVLNLTTLPKNILIIDTKREKNAVVESIKVKEQQLRQSLGAIKLIGIIDTNSDPTEMDIPIVVNDDSPQTLEYVLDIVFEAYLDGQKKHAAKIEAEAKSLAKKEAKVEAKKDVKVEVKPTAKK